MSLTVNSSKRDTLVFRGFQTVKSWIQTRLSGCGTRSANVQWNRAYCRKRYHRVTRGDARNYGIDVWNRDARNLSTDAHGMALCRLIRD